MALRPVSAIELVLQTSAGDARLIALPQSVLISMEVLVSSIRRRLSFANVISCIALFVALGGAGYAATQLPKNSVGAKQIKPNAVTSSKVKNGSLGTADFKSSELSKLQGPAGPAGPQGPTGAQGEPGPLLQTLPSGKTLTGAYGAASTRSNIVSPYVPGVEVSYPIPLSFSPKFEIVKFGQPPTATCPGSAAKPAAAPGRLCLYGQREDVSMSIENLPAEGHYGFLLFFSAAAGENYENHGTWAVTAP
jgi:hypothetical protein